MSQCDERSEMRNAYLLRRPVRGDLFQRLKELNSTIERCGGGDRVTLWGGG